MNSLKTWRDFQIVLSGEKSSRTAYFSLHSCERSLVGHIKGIQDPLKNILFGALVPKRCAKRAVTRNSIKRQIRSIVSQQTTLSSDKAYVIRLHKEIKSTLTKSADSDVIKEIIRNDLIVLFEKMISK
jgi:ribonuclease P protein component